MRLLLLAFLILTALPAMGAEVAGKVLLSIGTTAAFDAQGRSRSLSRGAPVYSGDTVATTDGRLQIRFRDGAMLSLSKNTRFRVDSYHYSGKSDSSEKSWFSLLKGGIRSISGAIGKIRHKAYRVSTVVATIGIRGTVYKAQLCEGDCAPKNGKARPDGLYLDTSAGTVVLSNNAGSLDVPAGKSAYVADINTLPVLQAPTDATSMLPVPEAAPTYRAGEQQEGHHVEPMQSEPMPPAHSPPPGQSPYVP
jgi:hypothetical protein